MYSNWTSQVAANSFTEDFCFAIPYSNDANGATLTKGIKIVDDVMFAVACTHRKGSIVNPTTSKNDPCPGGADALMLK